MNKEIFNSFPPEYRELILRYKKDLEQIFKEYQVVIFMARKAICFYKSLVISGFIDKPQNCEIYSSRILTYNIHNKFKDKKVVVVDDVMIKGRSLNKALEILHKNHNIKADVYIMARPKVEDDDILKGFNIVGTFAEITNKDTLAFSKHIADFIESNMCPYNIDQPVYSLSGINESKITNLIKTHKLIDISSELQSKHEIKSYVLKIPNDFFAHSPLKEHIELCKIRFLFGKYYNKPTFLIIPFVLLGEIEKGKLNNIFSKYDNQELHQFIFDKNDRITCENQLKILHYILAAELMQVFTQHYKITNCERLVGNDDFIFSKNILELINHAENFFSFSSISSEICFDYEFKKNDYLNHTFDYLYSDKMHYTTFSNSENEKIDTELLILSELKKYIVDLTNKPIDELVFSNVIDSLIDKGLIIPSIVHGFNNTIIRAYKCGEVYALNKEHFRLFAYTLCQYLKGINHTKLQKTEFEKLCVLFFRAAIQGGILKYGESKGEIDEYSICYSKFGPRVSTSKPIYSANETSTLASKLLNLNHIEVQDVILQSSDLPDGESSNDIKKVDSFRQITYYHVKEITKDDIANAEWTDVADSFAKKHKLIYKAMFNEEDGEILFDEVRNMHMRNYIEFLVMLSIGLSKKEQLLSLLAEIYLVDSVEINGTIHQILFQYNRIFDGLISGMWKYMCYKQETHPLKKVQEKLDCDESTEHLSVFITDIISSNRDIDKNEHINPMIDEAGKLIFSIAYSIWFMCKKYHVTYHIRGEVLDLATRKPREFYYKNLKDLRKSIEEQISISSMEQDLQTLTNLKTNATQIIERYNIEISDGRRQKKKNASSSAGSTINGDVQTINYFEQGAEQHNGYNN